jgi:hypothetical protein
VIQYRLSTLLLAFVVVAASLGLCGAWGIVVAAVLLAVAAYARKAKTMGRRFVRAFVILPPLLCVGFIGVVVVTSKASYGPELARYDLARIGEALQKYKSVHGSLPPPVTTDNHGKPMHSWRVLALPFLKYPEYERQYLLNEPWDGPNNANFAAMDARVYDIKSDSWASTSPFTDYVAVTGPGTAWESSPAGRTDMACREGRSVMVAQIVDSNILWREPRDMTLDEVCAHPGKSSTATLSGSHRVDYALFLFSDGSIERFDTSTPPEVLRGLLTGDDRLREAYEKHVQARCELGRAREYNEERTAWATLATLVLSYVVLLCWPTGTTPVAET